MAAMMASFTPAAARTPLQMPTSAGKMRDMEQVGTLSFTLKGQLMSLGAFLEVGTPPDRLFVPFTDLTSGTETYAAGRYLELDRTATGIYTIDFNRAFHPYCYYNDDYDCPYPPPSNRLPVPVRAGETAAAARFAGLALDCVHREHPRLLGPSPQLREARGRRLDRVLEVDLPFRPAQVRGQDHRGAADAARAPGRGGRSRHT